jgi:glycine betaine/choline ABC-type transport system substrate-binding protein
MDRTKTVACLSLLLLAACSRPAAIVVGSKNFTEQVVLGEILALQIERQLGVPVVRKLDLGGTLLAHEALKKGEIDLYPEYTGTALTAILKQPPFPDRTAVRNAVRSAYLKQWQLEWLPPLGFNNTFAMIVRRDTANAEKLATLTDAARAHAWRLGAGYEFRQRPDGLVGLLHVYGLRTDGDPVTMDLGLLYSALQSRKVDLIAANATDGLASVLDVVVLDDNRHYFPPYECAVVVREPTLAKYPQLREVLSRLSGRISDETMRKLNCQVDGRHLPVHQVAGEFLDSLSRQK